MKRLNYVDYLRGLAIVFMVINHVGHYLMAQPISSIWVYFAIYLTVTWAAPLFLFLAGFSLAIIDGSQALRFDYLWRRGLMIILAGVAVNLFFYPDAPWYFGRILLAIGAGLILSYPLIKSLNSNRRLLAALIVGILLLLAYPLAHEQLVVWVSQDNFFTRVLLGEFPLYPWVTVLFIGLISGKYFLSLNEAAQRQAIIICRRFGLGLLALWFGLILICGYQLPFSFGNDFTLGIFWLPSDITWLWIGASLLIFCPLMFDLRCRNYFWLRALKILGSQALPIYFLQFLIIKTIGGEWLGWRFNHFYQLILASLIVILILCYLARSKAFARIMALNPLKARGRIF